MSPFNSCMQDSGAVPMGMATAGRCRGREGGRGGRLREQQCRFWLAEQRSVQLPTPPSLPPSLTQRDADRARREGSSGRSHRSRREATQGDQDPRLPCHSNPGPGMRPSVPPSLLPSLPPSVPPSVPPSFLQGNQDPRVPCHSNPGPFLPPSLPPSLSPSILPFNQPTHALTFPFLPPSLPPSLPFPGRRDGQLGD